MNLAVKPYEFAPPGENELNLPDDYPWKVVSLGESTTLPDQSGQWSLVTLEAWNAGAAARAVVFAAAVAASTPPPIDYYVKAKCADLTDQGNLYDLLVQQNYECEKIPS